MTKSHVVRNFINSSQSDICLLKFHAKSTNQSYRKMKLSQHLITHSAAIFDPMCQPPVTECPAQLSQDAHKHNDQHGKCSSTGFDVRGIRVKRHGSFQLLFLSHQRCVLERHLFIRNNCVETRTNVTFRFYTMYNIYFIIISKL